MTKYRVYLVAVAETVVEVEAEDEDQAFDLAFENAPAGANISNDFDMSEWDLASNVWPGHNKPEEDIEVIDE